MLALALGGRTVAEWQAAMSMAEFDAWVRFYRAHPFDDLHRYHRPAALVSVSLAGGDVAERLQWLAPEPVPEGLTPVDLSVIRALGLQLPERTH